MSYVVYHKHDHYSNVAFADSIAKPEDYAARISELDGAGGILSTCNHGTPGNWLSYADIAKKAGLKWRYVVESYFVKDRHSDDRTNAHIILAAKTKKGIYDLNEVLSEANISGFYYRPRVDLELLESLDPKDVFITTACIAGIWRYEDHESLLQRLHNHFRDSMMLEVQAHPTEKQKAVNLRILDLYRKYQIPLIAATDSHYIHESDAFLRKKFQEAKGVDIPDEDGWLMDVPSEDEFRQRFRTQGVLSVAQINEAIENTLIFHDFEDVEIDSSKKIPTIFPDLSQEARNERYRNLIITKWNEYKKSVPEERWPEYEAGINYEMDTVTETNTSDYFLLDYEIVRQGKQRGGMMTYSGRGSAVSFITNMLLGFSSVDRFLSPVVMYPDRFISKDRILSGSLPDIDLNVADPDPFEAAQAEILGDWRSQKMIAFGTMKAAAAWKTYCRVNDVPFETANKITANIRKYEDDYKHAEEDERDDISIYDYIPAEYHEIYRSSEQYQSIIDSISPHPCAYLLYQGPQDIRREIGVYRINNVGSKKKTVFAAFVDGQTAERYGYLKNDLLTVSVVAINAAVYKEIGIPQPTVPELMKLVENDKATWDIYAKGYGMGINQVEQPKTLAKVMRYKPKNLAELANFVAAVRPAFQSMIEIFLSRKHFDYGIPAFDNLIQTKQITSTFVLMQEQLMATLQFAGFTAPESYAAIKAIAKKHPEKVLPLKDRFYQNFSARLVNESGVSESRSIEMTDKVWQIISDATAYSFNASHAVCMALDSLYGAYAKAHYPYAYYTCLLKAYAAKGNKKKIALVKEEMQKAFGISIAPCRFRSDNRDFSPEPENHRIADALTSIKNVSIKAATVLYDLRNSQFDCFMDLLHCLTFKPNVNKNVIWILIMSDYFAEFGDKGKLLECYHEFYDGDHAFKKSLVPASQTRVMNELRDLECFCYGVEVPPVDQLRFEQEYYGQVSSVYPERKNEYLVLSLDTKYSPKVKLYNISTGRTGQMKIRKPTFSAVPFEEGQIISFTPSEWHRAQAMQFVDGKRQYIPNVYDLWIDDYRVLKEEPK